MAITRYTVTAQYLGRFLVGAHSLAIVSIAIVAVPGVLNTPIRLIHSLN